jgi:hypothetical protein
MSEVQILSPRPVSGAIARYRRKANKEIEAMKVRIYRPAKTAMQSGQARTEKWLLEFEPAAARSRNPLTGWTSSADTRGQVRLSFETLEEAIAYSDRQGFTYTVQVPHRAKRRAKSYADNFRFQRPA